MRRRGTPAIEQVKTGGGKTTVEMNGNDQAACVVNGSDWPTVEDMTSVSTFLHVLYYSKYRLLLLSRDVRW